MPWIDFHANIIRQLSESDINMPWDGTDLKRIRILTRVYRCHELEKSLQPALLRFKVFFIHNDEAWTLRRPCLIDVTHYYYQRL